MIWTDFFIAKVIRYLSGFFRKTGKTKVLSENELVSTRFTPLDGPPKKGTFWGCVRKKWPSWGGGQIVVFGACVAQLVWPSSKYRWGGQHYIFFESSRLPKTVFTCVFH